MSSEIRDLLDLADAACDTQLSASAVWHLRNELAAVGFNVTVDWRAAVDAQRQVELSYLGIIEAIKGHAREAIK
jgi:hypothetical protein